MNERIKGVNLKQPDGQISTLPFSVKAENVELANGDNLEDKISNLTASGDNLENKISNLNASDVGALPSTGGTVSGTLKVGNKISIYTDGEGGNIDISAPDTYGNTWQIDAYNGHMRIFNRKGDTYTFPLTLSTSGSVLIENSWKIPQILSGEASITPTAANTPTSQHINFSKSFSGVPVVVVGIGGTVPGTTVLGASATNITASGFDLYVTRTNTTAVKVYWIAVYN